MQMRTIWRSLAGAVTGICLPAMLAGCFLSPGSFDSTLDLRKDGAFAFAYKGEIHMMALSSLADMADKAEGVEEFEQEPCIADDGEERDCTSAEIEQQRADWAEAAEARKKDEREKNEAFRAMLGGVDPADPQAAQEIASRLARQNGWNSVEYKGDGLFVVDFSISSRLGHDFVFPVLEGTPMANPFVMVIPRDGGTVRIEAPAFSAQSASANPMAGFMQAASTSGKDGETGGQPKALPELTGHFTITTDGAILANNTDEGPQTLAGGQQLSWTITRRTAVAPSALIRLGD